jgi:septal ring factor EnvC (AmiA/AmiB activator)
VSQALALVALGLALLGAGSAAPAARAQQGSASELERIRAEIEMREARARQLTEQADSLLSKLEALDLEIVEVRNSRRKLTARESAAVTELEAARAGIAQADQQIGQLERALGPRLVALYKFSATGGLPALYAEQRDFQSALRMRDGLSRVLAADMKLFSRYREARTDWQRRSQQAESLVREIELTRDEVQRRRELERQKRVERRNLAALALQRAGYEKQAAAELRAAGERLEQQLAKFAPRPAVLGGELVKGALPHPVKGKIRTSFGIQTDPEYQTQIRSAGIEISAERGTDVQAVAAGRVVYAGWFRGYGQVVIVDHGGENLTVSGYLDELSVQADAVVARGQRIGVVGDTGSLLGPGLYFELRQRGVAVDPRPWFEPMEGKS